MLASAIGLLAGSFMAWKVLGHTAYAVAGPPPAGDEPTVAVRALALAPRARPLAPCAPIERHSAPVPIRPARATRRWVAPAPLQAPAPAGRPRPGSPAAPQVLHAEPRRVRVGDGSGRTVVARVYGGEGSRAVLLPDGSLGWPNGMAYTPEPFRPLPIDELADNLARGPYRHFRLHRTDHYLIFYTSTPEFARQSGQLLESLYQGLLRTFRDWGLPVHESEFPMVAVAFRNETEFREHRDAPKEVQACYDVLSNRIFFFENRDRDPEAPEVAAMRKPQTIAHEGTHQVLQNIGVQPRLARWPAWLVEGLAEYCAPTTTRGGKWAGFGQINPFHAATIAELEDTLALQGRSARLTRNPIGRAPGRRTVLDLLDRDELSPTDYALAWGMTHFLATKRRDAFVGFLKQMSELPPLDPRASEMAARAFRANFGEDAFGLGQQLHRYLGRIKAAEPLPYYLVIFEQPIGDGLFRRGTVVSQSPLIIQQWLAGMTEGDGTTVRWWSDVFAKRTDAFAAAERWIQGR